VCDTCFCQYNIKIKKNKKNHVCWVGGSVI